MKRKTSFVALSIILLFSAVTIVTPTGCCYCPFCPQPSDTPAENSTPAPTPTPIPIRPNGGQYDNPNFIAYIDELKSTSLSENPDVVIVDVRSPEKYAEAHIPGAINLPWYSFRENGVLIPLEKAAEKLGENGISREDRVIVYSDTCKPCGGLPASSYVAWLLEYLGHENVSLLDGGFDAWNTTGYGCTKSMVTRPPTLYIAKPREDKFADTDWVQNNLNNTRVQIVDARTAEEYNAGHIDGATNIDHELLLRKGFRMNGAYDLKYLFLGKGLDKSRDTVVYCRSGARSSFLYLALSLMDYKVRNYDGSWNVWSKTHPVPVITISNVSVNPGFVYTGTPVKISAEVEIPSLNRRNVTGIAGTSRTLLFPGYRNAAHISNPFFSWDRSRSAPYTFPSSGTSNSFVRAYIHKADVNETETVALNDYDGDGKYTGEWQTFLVEDGTYYVNVEASDGLIKTEKKNAAMIEVATDVDGPLISNVSVSPHLAHPGSEIKISANISDPSGVMRVTAQIKRNNETVQNIPLSDPDRDGRYIGVWKSSRYAEIGTYCVSITATDRKFNNAWLEDAVDFVIEGSF